MKNHRLNRSLSSVKSFAPAFASLRSRHASAYDFRCRCCGELLQPEKEAFEFLRWFLSDKSFRAANGPSVSAWLHEWHELQALMDQANTAMEASIKNVDRVLQESAEATATFRVQMGTTALGESRTP